MEATIERGRANGIPYRRLGKTGFNVSAISLGCAPMGGVFGAMPHNERLGLVRNALQSGLNLMDTSPYYGATASESNLGRCLSELASEFPRDSYYLCTKVGRYENDFDYSASRVERSVEESLSRLRTDRLDIVSVHDFEFAESLDQIWLETLPALAELQTKGIVGHIGLGARPLPVIELVAQRFGFERLSTLLTYNHWNLCDERLRNLMPRLCKYDIGVMQGGVTLMGLLTPQGPQSWNTATSKIKHACAEAVRETGADILRLGLLHAMDNENIGSVLVGCTSREQLQQNMQWLQQTEWMLDAEDRTRVEELQTGVLADVMNIGWIEKGSERNICRAILENEAYCDEDDALYAILK